VQGAATGAAVSSAADGGASVRWQVDVGKGRATTLTTFDVLLSTDGDFEENYNNGTTTTTLMYRNILLAHACTIGTTSTTGNATVLECHFEDVRMQHPLWLEVFYVKVRSVGVDYIPGEWSATSKQWLTAKDCSNETDASQHLQLGGEGHNPMDYSCLTCPLGGSCDGSVVTQDIRAMFGYWQCNSQTKTPTTSTSPTTSTTPTTTLTPQFAPCAYVAACLGATNPRLPSNKYMTPDNVDLARLGNAHSPALANGSTCALVRIDAT